MILDYKECKVFYTDAGKGAVVVLLHGFLENSSMWNVLLPLLIKNHRVICIDLLGHGQSECMGYIHTMDTMADVVDTVLNSLEITKSTLIGHSMGGYVALAYAEKNSEKLNGLCLMNSTYEADDEELKLLRSRANKMVQNNFKNMVRISFTNLFSTESKTKHKVKIENALAEGLKTSIQGYIAAQEGMRIRKNMLKMFNSLSCKKLIIIGEKDPVINGNLIVNQTKNSDIEVIKFSEGHMPHIENISIFLRTIMCFIEK